MNTPIRPVVYPLYPVATTPNPESGIKPIARCPDGSLSVAGQPCDSDFAQNNLIAAATRSMAAAWATYSQGCPTGSFAKGDFTGPSITVKMSGFAGLPVSQINALINKYTPLMVSGVQGFAVAASQAADAAAFIAQHYSPAASLAHQAAAQAQAAKSLAPIVANQGTGNTTGSPWGNTPWCWANGQALSNSSGIGGTTESFCPNLAWLQNGWAVYQAAESALQLAEQAMQNWRASFAVGVGECSKCSTGDKTMQDNEWGIAAPATTTTTTPSSPLTDTLVGSALGVVLGGLAGAYFKHTAIGAVAGGMVGAAGGYWYSTPPATTTTTTGQ